METGRPETGRGGPPAVRAWPFLTRLVSRSVREFADDKGPHFAASISYRVLFSLFPLAIVLTGLFGLVLQLTGLQADVVDTIVRNAPLSEEGKEELGRLLRGATGGMSALGLLGLVGLVWAASGMMGAIRLALNHAWDLEDRRPFLQGKAVDVLLVFGGSLLVLLSLGLSIGARLVERYAGTTLESVGIGAGVVGAVGGLLVPLVLAFAAVLFLYRTVPAVRPRLRDVWPAALFVAVVFVALQAVFAIYVEHFGNYNAVYGSLGAVVAFLLFVYLASSVLLLGAEVAAEWPRVRASLEREEGTDEPGEPLGSQIAGFLRGLVLRPREPDGDREGREEREEETRAGGEAPKRSGPDGGAPRFAVERVGPRYELRLEAGDEVRSWTLHGVPSPGPRRARVALAGGACTLRAPEPRAPKHPDRGSRRTLWDTGTYRSLLLEEEDAAALGDAVERGHLSLWLDGERLHGGHELTRLGGHDEWLVVKLDDRPGAGDGQAPAGSGIGRGPNGESSA